MQVTPGKKVMLLARRDGAQIRFSLRAGTGSPAATAPWKEEWGGGASVENPHFQRVHYCELLVSPSSSSDPHGDTCSHTYVPRHALQLVLSSTSDGQLLRRIYACTSACRSVDT